jgi:hypothetical protein
MAVEKLPIEATIDISGLVSELRELGSTIKSERL